jgi:hypothetical protein
MNFELFSSCCGSCQNIAVRVCPSAKIMRNFKNVSFGREFEITAVIAEFEVWLKFSYFSRALKRAMNFDETKAW